MGYLCDVLVVDLTESPWEAAAPAVVTDIRVCHRVL
jgi:hypothetical protein